MAASLGLSNLGGAPPMRPVTPADADDLQAFMRRAYHRPVVGRTFTFPTSSSRESASVSDDSYARYADTGRMSTLDVLAAAASACLPSTSRAPSPPPSSRAPSPSLTLPPFRAPAAWHPDISLPPLSPAYAHAPPSPAYAPPSPHYTPPSPDYAQSPAFTHSPAHAQSPLPPPSIPDEPAPPQQRTPRRVFLRLPARASSDDASRSVSPSTTAGTGTPPRDTPPLIRRRPPRTRLPVPTPNVSRPSRGRHVPIAAAESEHEPAPPVTARVRLKLAQTQAQAQAQAPAHEVGGGEELSARVFVCEVEGCGKCFRRREHLKRHMLSLHTNDRPFRCPDCDKVCNRRDNLVQHRKIHAQDAAKI